MFLAVLLHSSSAEPGSKNRKIAKHLIIKGVGCRVLFLLRLW